MAIVDGEQLAEAGHNSGVEQWEYARLEYRATGDFGTDRFMDWRATFYTGDKKEPWGTDDRYDDIAHLNRAGLAGWQAYDRTAAFFHGESHRLQAVTYSLRRRLP